MKRLLWIVLFFISNNCLATSFVWNGDGDGFSWEDDDNWAGNVAPGQNIQEEVIINDAGQTVELSTDVTVGYLHIIGSTVEVKSSGILRIGHTSSSTLSQTLLLELDNSSLEVNGDLLLRSSLAFHSVDLDGGSLLQIGNSGYMYYFLTEKGIYINSGSSFEVQNGGWANLPLTQQAITNYGTILNEGKISITFQDYGIDNYGDLINQDTLTIQAISSGGLRGLYNADSVNNQSYIFIEGCKEIGIHSTGQIINELAGYIEVKRFSSTVVPNSKAFHLEGLCENKGKFTLNARNTYGLYNENNNAGLINLGTFNIYASDSLGLFNEGSIGDSSLFINMGRCNISETVRNGDFARVAWNGKGVISSTQDGILNYSIFEASDSLTIDVGETGIYNNGNFEISGPVVFNDSKKAILNEKSFTVTSTGSINTGLLTASVDGYSVKNTDYFKNEGSLVILSGSEGLINENSLQGFHNEGTLSISGINDKFLSNLGTGIDTSYFFNTGSIIMHSDGSPNDGIKGFGIFNSGKGSFSNQGSITMSQFWDVFDNIVNEAKFVNEGVLDFRETRGMNINNTGTFTSTTTSSSIFQCDENFNDFGILNGGTVTLDGITQFEYNEVYDRNMPLIQNNATFTNLGHLSLKANSKTEGILNTGTFINKDSLTLTQVDGGGIENHSNFTNDLQGVIRIDTSGLMTTGISFANKGFMSLKNTYGISVAANESFENDGTLIIEDGQFGGLSLIGLNALFTNKIGAKTVVSNIDLSTITSSAIVIVDDGHLVNNGIFSITGCTGRGLALIQGQITNTDSMEVNSIDDIFTVQLEDGVFANGGYFLLNGEGESSTTLLQIDALAEFENEGTVEIIDAFNRGIYALGTFESQINSEILFTNNTRNSGNLFYHSNLSSPIVYNGSMTASNSQNCVNFANAAINNGLLDLRSCGINMLNGTNSTSGHIISKDLSYIGENNGLIEYVSDDLFSLIGTNIMTNNGVMVDHGDAFRNVKFNDGDALGFPIWNKGLFVSPFYGTLSDGIKETINLNYTENGSLPISTTWWADIAKTTPAGTWNLTDHYFTPNNLADNADSLFFEVDLTGSNPVVISVPHVKPSLCPQPIITKILRTKPTHSWNDHTSWRGNRAPGFCERASFSGNEDIYVPSGYKVQINTFEFTPGIGPNRFIEIETGAVFETNLLEFE